MNSACPNGYIESVDYLGTNADGNDVYQVKFMHSDQAYIFMPPGPDGKITKVWMGAYPSSLADVPPGRSHKIAMYRRPWH
jgi:hypothetical protein